MTALLDVEALRVRAGATALLDGVDLTLDAGETLGLVGESGCGKSLLALAVMGLLPGNLVASGAVRLAGQELLGMADRELCRVRGRQIGMVFQEPKLALNPVQPIGRQVAEGMRLQLRVGRAEADARTRRLLDQVGLQSGRVSPDAYPHTLSGGQRQRVMIAIALASDPALLIADEFSTALDGTTQAQIVVLMAGLAAERGMALLLITHDLRLAARAAGRILVLYAGRVAETGPTDAVFARRLHPYTQGLFAATLQAGTTPGSILAGVSGRVPDPYHRSPGCAFAPRCPRAEADCVQLVPALGGRGGHAAACLHQRAA